MNPKPNYLPALLDIAQGLASEISRHSVKVSAELEAKLFATLSAMEAKPERADAWRFASLNIARAALLAEIRAEFSDFDEVPDIIVKAWNARLIDCTAWHNDMCPSFVPAGTDGTVSLFIDYLETTRRGSSWREADDTTHCPRFTAQDSEADGDQVAYCGDDLEKALAFILVPQDRTELCAMYENVIGYNPAKDSPDITTEEISNTLSEYFLISLRE